MAQIEKDIKIKIQAEDKTQKGFNDARKAVDDFGKNTKKVMTESEKSVTHFADSVAGAIAVAFSVKAVTNFTKAIFKLGSQSVETSNLFAVSFGSMTMDMNKFGKELQKVSGISDLSFRNQSARINNLFKTNRIGAENSMKMTQDLMSRGLDLSSLFNVDRDQVFDNINSGIVGMIKPLRKFGINLEIENVKTYAYANGIAELGTELNQTQKMQARYMMILEQSQHVQGDMSRTIDTAANASRKMKDELTQAGTVLGRALNPLLVDLLKLLVPVVKLLGFMATVVAQVSGLIQKLKSSSPILNNIIGLIQILIGTLITFTAVTTMSKLAIFGKIKALFTLNGALSLTNLKLSITNAIASKLFIKIALVVAIIYIFAKLLKMLTGDTNKLNDTLEQNSLTADDFASDLGNINSELDDMAKKQRRLTPLDEIVNLDSSKGSSNMAGGFNIGDFNFDDAIGNISDLTDSLEDIMWLGDQIAEGWTRLPELWSWFKNEGISSWWEGYKLIIDGVFDTMSKIALKIREFLPDFLTKPWDNFIKRIEGLKELWESFKDGGVGGVVKTVVKNTATPIVRDVVSKVIPNPINELIKKMPSFIGNTFGRIIGLNKNANGGTPSTNNVNLVGERGPELFIPNQRGTVVSNDDVKRSLGGNNQNEMSAIMGMLSELSNSQNTATLNIDGRDLAKLTYGRYESEGNRNGIDIKVKEVA